jgi:chorismate synthase
MAGNVFGRALRLITFGESHGAAMGGVLEGLPSGVTIDEAFLAEQMARRQPGQAPHATSRKEPDRVELLSGISNGISTGTPIGFLIANRDARPTDYTHLESVLRPGHGDFTYLQKYGLRHASGGGRASARETSVRVAAGAIAQMFLALHAMRIRAWVSSIGTLAGSDADVLRRVEREETLTENIFRFPHPELLPEVEAMLEEARLKGDTLGGTITCCATGVPPGLGEPVFDKLEALLAQAMMSINATRAFEMGEGFASCTRRGSEVNDLFETDANGTIRTQTNRSGGVQAGISNGMPVWFRVGFKPVSTLQLTQPTVTTGGEPAEVVGKGRHDVCVVPRAVPIVEAMTALVLADLLLQQRTNRA